MVLLVAVLMSCAPAAPPTTPTPKPTGATAPAPVPATTAPPAANPSQAQMAGLQLTPNDWSSDPPKKGGIITYTQIAGPGGYDLHQRPAWAGGPCVPIYSNLVQVNPAYQEAVISNIVGDLAERWDISPDGTKYTFYLVKNAKWHDGKPFTADDVIYSLDKIMDTKAGSRMAGTLEAMKDYTKVDDYTVVMNTKYPSPGFLVNVANPYNVIQPKHMAGKDNKSTDFLVGTGPFKFKEYIPESSFSLVRNPDYFKKDKNGVQLPYLDGITIYIMKAGGVDAFIAKKLDMVNPMQLVATKSDYDKIRASAPDARLFEVRANTPYCIWLNLKSAPLKDPKVLQALALVFNSEDQLLARVGDLMFGQPDRGLFRSAWANPVPEVQKIMGWADATGKLKPYDQRIKEAQQLMKESKYPDGFTVRMAFTTLQNTHAEASFIEYGEKLKKNLNIKYELKTVQSTPELEKIRNSGEWDMLNEVFNPATVDPDSNAAYFKTSGTFNFMGYSNARVDALFDQQAREMDIAKRAAISRDIEAQILKDRPVLPGAFFTGYVVYYPYVKNFGQTWGVYGPENKFEQTWKAS
jgi:peptide/nickel transport system substrate-binding protein